MSATMQENLFPSYFNNCPIVYVSGRTFPISMHYIEEVHEVVARGQRLLAVQRGEECIFIFYFYELSESDVGFHCTVEIICRLKKCTAAQSCCIQT